MKHQTPLQIARNMARQEEQTRQAQTAAQFIEAVKTIANKPANLDNLERYLSNHFPEWLYKFANTPEKITAELTSFANMEI